jgi:TetR/AcrR family transcriptional repressor of nem operon
VGRASKADATKHRQEVVSAAARLFRERGVRGVSVPDLMSEVGLTHGGFYRQFESKEALVGEATAHAFDDMRQLFAKFESEQDGDRPTDQAAAQKAFAQYYLSPTNRDDLGDGCPAAGLGTDISREKSGSEARNSYAAGVTDFAAWMSEDDHPDFATISTMVGALILYRATADTALSDRILSEALASLRVEDPAS